MQKITTFLWFDANAEEAARFYCGIFKNSKIHGMSRYGESGPGPRGTVLVVDFELEGQRFQALNGGPHFKFTEAISLMVHCKDQGEIDDYWRKLTTDGGQESQCGWLKDRFGLSWQVVPTVLGELLTDKDPQKRERVMKALMPMKKLDIAMLKKAAEGK